jgi:hypothetical protein
MSRSVVRVSISLLIALVLLAGIYTVVYGAAPFSRISNASMAFIAGSQRHTKPVLNTYDYSDVQRPAKVHDCDFDSGYSTDD